MFLSNFSVKKPVTIIMVILIIVILGTVSLTRIPTDLFPSINIPIAAVSTTYIGASPEEIESIVTKTLESSISTVSNVKNVTSVSSENSSLIIIEFESSANMDSAMLELRERIDMVTPYLPDSVSAPVVLKFNPNMMPIMGFAATKDDDSLLELTNFIEKTLSPRLERIEGVASVSVTGGSTSQVEINIDQDIIDNYGIDINTISSLLSAQNYDLPVGSITDNGTDYTVRSLGAFKSLEDIKNLTLASQAGIFKLSDIADVTLEEIESNSYSKVNGENSLTITLQRQSEYNTTEVAKKVSKEIDAIREEYPDVNIVTILDQSDYINQMVSSVSMNAIAGAILAILVLLLFLKDLRPTLVIGIAIPISVIATFILIYFFGITLNIISLGGLALGIGMLVDNSIVVLENIYRLRKLGMSRIEAALKGSSQIAGAIVASTLTTVSVFLPVVFVQGITAQLFKEMALTVTMSLLSSLFIALTLVPMLSSKLLKNNKKSENGRFFEFLKREYHNVLSFSLHHRILIVVIALVIFSGSIWGVLKTGTEFFPASDEGQINISVTMPKGTTFNDTVNSVSQIEVLIEDIEEIDTVSASVEGSASGLAAMMGSSSNTGTIDIVLVSSENRSSTSQEVAANIRELLVDVEGDVQVTAQTSNFMMMGSSPISIEIQGNDFDTLEQISNDVVEIVSGIPGTLNISKGIEKGAPELRIELDTEKATPLGLTNIQIYSMLSEKVNGITATTVNLNNKELDVVFVSEETKSIGIGDIESMMIESPVTGMSVPLSSIANVYTDIGYTQIERMNGTRVVSITCDLEDNISTGEAADLIEKALNDYDLEEGYLFNVAGENEEIESAFSDLYLALALAIVLIYMVMAAQFESLIHPFIIMFSIPLAFSGAFLGLLVTGKSLSVPAMIGMIVLAGIVVNNGIVLVDYINRLRAEGMHKNEAILEAGPIRLRPILMTALTTILALFPLALGIGEGAEMEAPLAIAVIGGLIVSTLLTLIVIPVIYSIFDSLSKRTRNAKRNEKLVHEN